MVDKAVIIVTDADILYCTEEWWRGGGKEAATMEYQVDGLSEQLLADLRLLLDAGAYVVEEHDVGNERDLLAEAVENVRVLLPEEES